MFEKNEPVRFPQRVLTAIESCKNAEGQFAFVTARRVAKIMNHPEPAVRLMLRELYLQGDLERFTDRNALQKYRRLRKNYFDT